MSSITIICDQMADGWNYDTCIQCRHFNLQVTAKGRKWSCSLNNKPASQKRKFRRIWALEYLRNTGMDISEDEITIQYVGKRKRKNDKEGNSYGNKN
jgi:hypothetical protein